MSTFYAVFDDPAKARLAVMRLLEQGVPTDDISLVSRDGTAPGRAAIHLDEEMAEAPMADATVFVGRGDDPIVDELLPQSEDPEARYYGSESKVGPGISTATFNDAAPTVEETDDPQSLAEETLEPTEGITQSARELHDLDLAVETGFPTTTPVIDNFEQSSVLPIDDFERSLETIVVPGFGAVIGGGALATAALDFGDGDKSDDRDVMMHHFREEGIPDDAAQGFLQAIEQGRALLAVGLVPGEVEAPLVEAVAAQFGAQESGTFDAPRY